MPTNWAQGATTVDNEFERSLSCFLSGPSLPVERALAACRRASSYGTYRYRGLKNILVRALDLQPLPVAATPAGLSAGELSF